MIKIDHLTKRYGDFTAVDDISFEISEGHVYGFLGPNGAGKSTTMNIMTGCLSASEGRVLIDNYDILEQPDEAKRLIGYLPEHPPLCMNESAVDYLTFVARAKGLKGEELKKQLQYVIEKTGIEAVKNKRISALSKGYKQRVGIAQALLRFVRRLHPFSLFKGRRKSERYVSNSLVTYTENTAEENPRRQFLFSCINNEPHRSRRQAES